jgi:hypothetical protein
MKKMAFAGIIFSISFLLISCNSYYRTALGTKPVTASTIEELKKDNRFFILRAGAQAFAMNDISISPDQKNLQCTLGILPNDHQLHLTKAFTGNMKYEKDEEAVLNEVHLYTASNGNAVIGPYTMGLDQVKKIEVLEPDKDRTRKSRNAGIAIGVGVAAAATVVTIIVFSRVGTIGWTN